MTDTAPKLSQLKHEACYQQLPKAFYAHVKPRALDHPQLAVVSHACADMLGLSPDSLAEQDALDILSGKVIPSGWQPLAMKYFGHQFGYLNPDLGDGRGLLMAQVQTEKSGLLDLHLKGSGTTPFSRQGDGRAVLRSSIREFLCSEALYALGIPTTRALCVVASDTPVRRETMEKGATLLRVARSHIRFGHFEFAYHSSDKTLLQSLCDHVAQLHFPCLAKTTHQNAELFIQVCKATARMIAAWQCIGFAHGVMNTDNMSILGETFDFGPFGFMDRFDAGYVCNHSDHQGRYAFDRQPAIGHWNLSVLAQAFSPVTESGALKAGIQAYSETFNAEFMRGMRAKLGLETMQEDDQSLVFSSLQLLQDNRLDYPWFFRQLSEANAYNLDHIRDHCLNLEQFDAWQESYTQRLQQENSATQARQAHMQATNPKYILRNHLAQEAIEAAEQGDFAPLRRLHIVLQHPFSHQEGCEDYAALPPQWAEGLEISCSS